MLAVGPLLGAVTVGPPPVSRLDPELNTFCGICGHLSRPPPPGSWIDTPPPPSITITISSATTRWPHELHLSQLSYNDGELT